MSWAKSLPLALLLVSSACLRSEIDSKKDDEKIEVPMPIGIPVDGIKIPQYDEKGNLRMLVQADSATKIDDSRIEMQKLVLEANDDEGRKIYVELPQGELNLDTRILKGSPSALIRRNDFEITGDAIEFNTITKNGKLLGNIKMTLTQE